MSNDNWNFDDDDKTMMLGGDATVMRPAPGGRPSNARVQASEPAMGASPSPSAGDPFAGVPLPKLQSQRGLNTITTAANTLLTIVSKLQNTLEHPNVANLFKQLVHEIRQFEQVLKTAGEKPETVLVARYVACSVIDEAVLNTPWGAASFWPQKSLLSAFHNETSGGEKFFLILQKLKARPQEHLPMLEFMYLCLSLGFMGKYRLSGHGKNQIEDLREDLYRTIRTYRGEFERQLSPTWESEGEQGKRLHSYLPLWVIASVAGAVLLLIFLGLRLWLSETTAPVYDDLEKVINPPALQIDLDN